MEAFVHVPVLLEEAVDALRPRPGGRYVDCTLGGAGHSLRLLKAIGPSGKLLALDQDEQALRHARLVLADYQEQVMLVHANFRSVQAQAEKVGWVPVDGVLFDLGVSSPQFDVAERGFSYRWDAPLDMRMDQRIPLTAADLVNQWSVAELARVFFEYGEERFGRRIAERIVLERQRAPIRTTGQLAEIVKAAIPAPARRTGPHPARRVFQALRMAVNDELGALAEGLQGAFSILAPGGRLAVITFHSLEDRCVKQWFQRWCSGCVCPPDFPVCRCGQTPQATWVGKKPVLPSAAEIAANPRARSAKLRCIEKL
ncbi:MAG: 16S rRNA (cytosine(1402)-N(4))-methyltransferase RsmH [Alicyclobacillus sp.]|nr:16S rRNA (cytosine(1402)-N(4))-methyltransferase RsmH [Alicyclobacillus sp.]